MNRLIFSFCMIAFLLDLFSGATAQVATRNYKEEIAAWDKERLASLKSATGWVNLVGLFWLKPGENSFGSDPSNALVYAHPEFPARLGRFILTEKEVIWKAEPGHAVLEKNKPFEQGTIFYLDSLRSLSLGYKTFRWSIIKREQLIGVRFRDLASPALDVLKKIDRFPVSRTWVLEAEFIPSLVPSITTTNILGQSYQQPHPGKIRFTIEGKTYQLDVVDEGEPDEYHIVFGDATNGTTSYESGRFIDIPKPDANGKTTIDFNKAYNPPCAFSEFSTCPIPSKANTLSISILAGEKKVH